MLLWQEKGNSCTVTTLSVYLEEYFFILIALLLIWNKYVILTHTIFGMQHLKLDLSVTQSRLNISSHFLSIKLLQMTRRNCWKYQGKVQNKAHNNIPLFRPQRPTLSSEAVLSANGSSLWKTPEKPNLLHYSLLHIKDIFICISLPASLLHCLHPTMIWYPSPREET